MCYYLYFKATGNVQLSTLTIDQLNTLLQANILNNCITNCSNQGSCVYQSGGLVCVCNGNYGGTRCQEDIRPCASSPCINNGTCIENIPEQTFTCHCNLHLFYGRYCENRVDLCANHTCSDNGFCTTVDNQPTCTCFSMYSGTNCEIKSAEKQTIENFISAASIISIICLITFYLIMVVSDAETLYRTHRQRKKSNMKKIKKKPKSSHKNDTNKRINQQFTKKSHLDYIPLEI